jgi:SAM-dependent methyltransferase
VADLQALPLPDGAVDVALCLHVLYHLPDQAAGVCELRRAVRPGGRALVLTNGRDAMAELSALVTEVSGNPQERAMLAFTIEDGPDVLGRAFDSVELHELRGGVDVTEAEAVVAYVASAPGLYLVEEEHLAEIGRRVQAIIDRDGAFSVSTVIGCFVCR